MTIENPPRLWAFAVRGAIHAAPEEAPLLASVHQGWGASKPQAYVREDVAEAGVAAAEAKYKNRDVEVMRVALADLRRIRSCLVNRAAGLRRIGEEARAMGVEDAIKQLDEEVFT